MPPPHSKKHKWDKSDWPAFGIQIATEFIGSREIWQDLHCHLDKGNLERAATLLRDTIQETCRQHIPDRHPSPQAKPCWTEKLSKDREHMKVALKNWRAGRTALSWNIWKKKRKNFFNDFREVKSEYWNSFLSGAWG